MNERLILLVAMVFFAGCAEPPATVQKTPAKSQPARSGDELTQAFDSIRKMAEGLEGSADSRPVFYLNQWMNAAEPDKTEWKQDRMVESIPRALKFTPGVSQLDSLEFAEQGYGELFQDLKKVQDKPAEFVGRVTRFQQDLSYLQETLWLHDVATRMKSQPPPADLTEWLKGIEKSVGLPEAEQLAAAERLFDWTVRNLQLDVLPPMPKGPKATVGEGKEVAVPALGGEVGPGYAHTPDQLLRQGHGDAHERARLFVLLCRQAGIDAVVLARIDEAAGPTPQPWVAAVMIGKELYLFEPELGLPIPGPEGKGIATLSQVMADDAVLRQLDVEGGAAYPHSRESLKGIAALIDAAPPALSRRMALLQKGLPAKYRLVLTIEPSRLEPKLRQSQGISTVSLWRVPFEAILYQIGRPSGLARNPEAARKFMAEEAYFHMPGWPINYGRNLHLQGKFESTDHDIGARAEYLRSRMPDSERKLLYTSAEYREMQGFNPKLPTNEEQKKLELDAMVTRVERCKQHATYWLGLTYFEEGKYDSAIEWLDKRTLRAPLPSPWAAGARYNLARCYEAQGKWDEARKLLAADDDSPQRHGNLLRAAWIAKRHAAP